MQKNDINKTGFMSGLKKKICDPVLLYTVVIMMSIMYHYTDTLYPLFGIASLIIGLLFFRIFEFMMKHNIIGTAVYIVTFVVLLNLCSFAVEFGYRSYAEYPLSFFVWFITPQAAVDFNFWYTVAVFLFFLFFMGSVIYYFTRVRYRVFMGFMIFTIPFAIYGKEAERMPIPFILILTMGYVIIMIYFRQLYESDTVVVTAKRETWKTVGVFAVIFAVAAAIVPKPKIEADRRVLETMISADQFTDQLLAMLSVFRETSSGGQYRNVNNNVPLYYALADEDLHLKTATFTEYDYGVDSWYTDEPDDHRTATYDQTPVQITNTWNLVQGIVLAADIDKDFAEKYGLSAFSPEDLTIPEEREMTIYSVFGMTEYAPVPQFAQELTDSSVSNSVEIYKTGLVRGAGKFAQYASFTYKYTADTFFLNEKNKAVIDALSDSDYKSLLSEASDILNDELRYWDYENDEIESYIQAISTESSNVSDFDLMLDYKDNKRIYELAAEITEGLESDYDKAKAIEYYFLRNDYVYDLSYVKSRGENVENFLFNTKRGVCYEYATAMVLLARASGIPARYCEGFLMSERSDNDRFSTNYVITPKTAHGYPELYIKGVGWMYFEPTLYNGEDQKNERSFFTTLMLSGLLLLGMLILVLVGIKFYPSVYHKVFVARCRKKDPNEAAKAAVFRIYKLYGITGVNTSHEAAAIVMGRTGADIYPAVKAFDSAVYGGSTLSSSDRDKCVSAYINAYMALKESKKTKKVKKEA